MERLAPVVYKHPKVAQKKDARQPVAYPPEDGRTHPTALGRYLLLDERSRIQPTRGQVRVEERRVVIDVLDALRPRQCTWLDDDRLRSMAFGYYRSRCAFWLFLALAFISDMIAQQNRQLLIWCQSTLLAVLYKI